MDTIESEISSQLESLRVLIVDDEPTMRKVTRSLLQAIGVKNIHEANDGRQRARSHPRAGSRRRHPRLGNAEPEWRGIRSPGALPGNFPFPDVPIIMLTAYGERSRVLEAVKVGVNEYLLKPVSSKALHARLVAILTKPRRMVKKGDYYGPEPRKISSYKPESDPG